ncbi:hypothetical protein SAMN05660443_0624 [Marinospirillum celere]|uniref:Uncharacterized protein n=1 Tax=Marinospirillum celere TaxID=1122252 RepID=A0A1I1EMN2_9GAMM|nr:hypothetical protein [Marinospirillum celere]SFB86768.1 hypothetical protein SAMN05660443_0624 [Marinospirillum celere]
MPLPIIPIALWGAGAAVVAAASYYLFSDSDESENKKEINNKVLVTGPKESGKTTLINYIANGENKLKIQAGNNAIINIEIDEWSFDKENDASELKKKVANSETVVYVVRYDAFEGNKNQYSRFKSDFYHIGKQVGHDEGDADYKILLIVTHCEKPLHNKSNINSFDDVHSAITKLPDFEKAVAQVSACDLKVVCGSMKKEKYVKALIEKIENHLKG